MIIQFVPLLITDTYLYCADKLYVVDPSIVWLDVVATVPVPDAVSLMV